MNLKKNIFIIKNGIWAATLLSVFLYGCEQPEMERLTSGSEDNNATGKLATLNISLQGIPEYNAPQGETRTARSSEPLIAEWVKVNPFDATRPIDKPGEAVSDDESGGSKIALMELREDAVSNTPRTRDVKPMPTGVYFRLIAFRKTSSNSYVFQSVTDYTANGSSSPTLKQGTMNLPVNQTYRFVAYSFNNSTPLGAFPESPYTWNSTSISIPDLYSDFLTYDSGDQTPTAENRLTLAISFTHQLCKLTVGISATGFDYNTFTNCTGVYISQGGSPLWTVGQDGFAANTDNSASFDIADNSTATVHLMPFDSPRPVTVHFGTLTVGGKPANNLDITSSQSVQLTKGKSYTITVRVSKTIGVKVPTGDIDLGGSNCSQQDKADLSLLAWAQGNLKSTSNGSANDYEWTTPTEYGYYYTFMSTYTGNTSSNGIDPCTKLKPDLYGSGWRTPNRTEITKLSRCTDKNKVNNNGKEGMWFMSNTKGVFLPAAGERKYTNGSGTSPNIDERQAGYYWSSTGISDTDGFYLYFNDRGPNIYGNRKTFAMTIRCVKGTPQTQ